MIKYYWLLTLMVCFSTAVTGQQRGSVSKTTRVYNEEGKVQMAIHYDPSCNCKTYTEFYQNGKVYAKRRFTVTDKSEYVDGEDITYYPDGSIKIYKLWKNALPEGRFYSNYENGKLEHEEFYEGKYKAGTWRYFNKKGELQKEHVYETGKTSWNSKKDNVVVKHYTNNKLAYTETLVNGTNKDKTVNDKASFYKLSKNDSLRGKALFGLKCGVCHQANKDAYGPALAGVTKRRTNGWLSAMIRNGMQLVESGDKQAEEIYNKWRKIKHPSYERLTEVQIQSLIDYLKTLK